MSKVYYKGDPVFLYIQFLDDNNNPIDVTNPQVRILHDNDGNIYEDLSWEDMTKMNDGEYYYNFTIPYTADLGQYQVLYHGLINGKDAYSIEIFHVINISDKYEDTVKLYGYVHDIRNNVPIEDATILITNTETNEKVSQSLTNREGYWESFVYPGMYKFNFNKIDYISEDVNVEIGDEHNEIQFNNIGLDSKSVSSAGNGIFQVKDKYVNKQSVPLNGLNIEVSNALSPETIIAKTITDDNGEWKVYLDSGTYILKVFGISLETEFNKIFRIKVDNNGLFKFENITKNIATISKNREINIGNGTSTLSDYVKNRHGNPIIDVQVNAYLENAVLTDENIIAQDYTNTDGKWTLKLNPGRYIIEYYHPEFVELTETRTVE